MLTILFLHGFASSGACGTAGLLGKTFPSARIIAPDIPLDPEEALPFLRELCATERPDIIIGTSMGGMYAQQMRGFLRICVNPSFNISTMSRVLRTGTHRWLNGRRNHEKEFRVTRDIIQHFNAMERRQFDDITPEEQELCHALFGTRDELSRTGYTVFTRHYTHALRFDGDHALNDRAMHTAVLPLMARLLGGRYEEARREPLPDYLRY